MYFLRNNLILMHKFDNLLIHCTRSMLRFERNLYFFACNLRCYMYATHNYDREINTIILSKSYDIPY